MKKKQIMKGTIDLPIVPRSLGDRIGTLLNSARRAVSADFIAEDLEVDVRDVKEELRKLVKAEIVGKGHIRGNTENLYWFSKFGFKPSKNIIGEVLMIPARITQIEASKRASSMLASGLFGKKEEIYDAEFSYMPIWRVSATRETRRLFFKKSYYFFRFICCNVCVRQLQDSSKIIRVLLEQQLKGRNRQNW